ncbi:MAG: hypothetical protein ACYTJ0_06060 [Planctomycetota bacterium]|jgi:hypothetical protein
MRYLYEPYVFKRMAEGRVFFVNSAMPFEFSLQCFQFELPFFLVSQLDDGRLAITPNAMFFSGKFPYIGFGPMELLPKDFEYVTMKDALYPFILTAHPIANVEEWFRKFERFVKPFARQSINEFVTTFREFQPLEVEKKKFVKEPVAV